MMEERVASSNRALSTLICKCKCRDIKPQFVLLSKLYNTLVTPVMDYEAEVWGVRSLERRVDKVQNIALRGFLGVGIHHPITALETESNWIPARWRVRMKVVLYWQKLLIRPDSVIVKRVINCILANNIKVEWVSKIVSIFDKLKLEDPTDCKSLSSNEFRTVVFSCLKRELQSEWKESIASSSKLQDLAGLLSISEPSYSTDIRNREVRSLISKIR